MNETKFSAWLQAGGVSKKLCSDYISRLKRIERSISDCDIDAEYNRDGCQYLLSLFKKMGQNPEMAKKMTGDLPIGKSYMAAFSYAIRKYAQYKSNNSVNAKKK